MKFSISQPEPSSLPSSTLQGYQIHGYGSDMVYRKFSNTPEETFQDIKKLFYNPYINTSQKTTKEVLVDKFEVYFSSMQTINSCENYEQPTVTIFTTFLNTMGGSTPYLLFGYIPQTVSNTFQETLKYINIKHQSKSTMLKTKIKIQRKCIELI